VEKCCCKPIGFVERPLPRGPRVPGSRREALEDAEELMRSPAAIRLLPEYCQGLRGLRRGQLLWVIWYAHLARGRPLEVHIYGDPSMPLLGVFATRSPARPCPLGLSLTVVDKVGDCWLRVYGLDAVGGTPVLDMKLYYRGLDDPVEALERARRAGCCGS